MRVGETRELQVIVEEEAIPCMGCSILSPASALSLPPGKECLGVWEYLASELADEKQEGEIVSVRASLSTSEVASLRDGLSASNAQLQKREGEIADLRSSLSASEAQLHMREGEIGSLRDSLSSSQKQQQAKDSEIASLRNFISLLQTDLAAKLAQLEEQCDEAASLQASLSADETLLRMQGSWTDVEGKLWHVRSRHVGCGNKQRDEVGDLEVACGGRVSLTVGGTTRTVKSCCTERAVHWFSGGDGNDGETCWAYMGDLFDLHTTDLRPWPVQYLSALSLSPASGCHDLAVTDACHVVLSEAFRSSIRGHRLHYKSDEWCEPAKINIEKIELLYNDDLVHAYFLDLKKMKESSPPSLTINAVECHSLSGCKNEYFLFHGAPKHVLDMIKEDGFDPRRGGDVAGRRFGVGSYFAENASKSDLYAKPDPDGLRSQLVVRVVLGNIHIATESLQGAAHAPYIDSSNTRMYDSVLASTREEGGCVDFREYIVYKAPQALPVAQIWYRHLPHCGCNLCRRG